jgi:hypothetical protein
MSSGWIEGEGGRADHFGRDANLSAHGIRQWRGNFVHVDDQRVAIPAQGTRPDYEMIGTTVHAMRGAFGHGPAPTARSVQRDIDGAMIIGASSPAQLVIRRKDAADEGDDGQAEAAVFAEGVDIPPGIAVWRDGDVEARSLSRHSTAWNAESAAIGTPAPGWVLPPAQ